MMKDQTNETPNSKLFDLGNHIKISDLQNIINLRPKARTQCISYASLTPRRKGETGEIITE